MKYNFRSIAGSAVRVILIFVIAMIAGVLILDVLISPIFGGLFVKPIYQDWCGIFSRCASGEQKSFIEYILPGTPWVDFNIAAIEDRLKRAILVGVLLGIAITGISIFSNVKK